MTESGHEFVVTHEGVQYGLAISFQGDVLHLHSETHWVVWTLDSKPLISNEEHVVMDLLNKQCLGTEKNIWVDTVREYLRKRGINSIQTRGVISVALYNLNSLCLASPY